MENCSHDLPDKTETKSELDIKPKSNKRLVKSRTSKKLRIIKVYSKDYRRILLKRRKRRDRIELIRMHRALREVPVGQFFHWEDGDYKVTILPVWRWGRYHITYYLRYGTEKPLDQINKDDILYIDKFLPRSMHWVYFHYVRSKAKRKRNSIIATRLFRMLSIQPDVLRHLYFLSKYRLTLINPLTLHAILAYYVSVRNRIGSSTAGKHHPERYTLNPFKFLTNKLLIRPSIALSLLNEGFAIQKPDSFHLLQSLFSVASQLELRPDALVGIPFLLLIHPKLQTVTIIGPHRNYYPVPFHRALHALSSVLDPESLEQVSQTLKSVFECTQMHLKDLLDVNKKDKSIRDRAWERIIIRTRTNDDYKFYMRIMHITMSRLERLHGEFRSFERKISRKREVYAFLKLVPPTGELSPYMRDAFEREKERRNRYKEEGIDRPGTIKSNFKRVYDMDYDPS